MPFLLAIGTGKQYCGTGISAGPTVVKTLPDSVWLQYKALLAKNRPVDSPVLPSNLQYCGQIKGAFDYSPSEAVLRSLRKWLVQRQEHAILYFLTETTPGMSCTSFEIDVPQLTNETLAEINTGFESVIVSRRFTWALFTDHNGFLHVAGPEELYAQLYQAWINSQSGKGQDI